MTYKHSIFVEFVTPGGFSQWHDKHDEGVKRLFELFRRLQKG
jgi:hypothetical protein